MGPIPTVMALPGAVMSPVEVVFTSAIEMGSMDLWAWWFMMGHLRINFFGG
jgi:hypothetical protein